MPATYYVALPFIRTEDGTAPGEAQECPSEAAAIRRAEGMSRNPANAPRKPPAAPALKVCRRLRHGCTGPIRVVLISRVRSGIHVAVGSWPCENEI